MSWVHAAWQWYSVNAPVINPIITFVGAGGAFATAAALAWAGVQNARTAARRHEEQTNADRQRRITESFSKAVEQLASEKIEVRLGSIYTLERISKESPDDHWVVMKTLTAFVREHARWKKPDEIASETLVSLYDDEKSNKTQPEPTADIAAVLTVIVRREIENRDRERLKDVGLNFRSNWHLRRRKRPFSAVELTGGSRVDGSPVKAVVVPYWLRQPLLAIALTAPFIASHEPRRQSAPSLERFSADR